MICIQAYSSQGLSWRYLALLLLLLLPVRRYKDAIVSLKAKVKETEGEDMREAIQDKVGAASLAPLRNLQSCQQSKQHRMTLYTVADISSACIHVAVHPPVKLYTCGDLLDAAATALCCCRSMPGS
jgi:hypothetical protein